MNCCRIDLTRLSLYDNLPPHTYVEILIAILFLYLFLIVQLNAQINTKVLLSNRNGTVWESIAYSLSSAILALIFSILSSLVNFLPLYLSDTFLYSSLLFFSPAPSTFLNGSSRIALCASW
jgi:hypothetical protein